MVYQVDEVTRRVILAAFLGKVPFRKFSGFSATLMVFIVPLFFLVGTNTDILSKTG
jgi:hypothetical protein